MLQGTEGACQRRGPGQPSPRRPPVSSTPVSRLQSAHRLANVLRGSGKKLKVSRPEEGKGTSCCVNNCINRPLFAILHPNGEALKGRHRATSPAPRERQRQPHFLPGLGRSLEPHPHPRSRQIPSSPVPHPHPEPTASYATVSTKDVPRMSRNTLLQPSTEHCKQVPHEMNGCSLVQTRLSESTSSFRNPE